MLVFGSVKSNHVNMNIDGLPLKVVDTFSYHFIIIGAVISKYERMDHVNYKQRLNTGGQFY